MHDIRARPNLLHLILSEVLGILLSNSFFPRIFFSSLSTPFFLLLDFYRFSYSSYMYIFFLPNSPACVAAACRVT